MATRIVWVVRENSNQVDGYGVMLNKCAFTWKTDAEAIVGTSPFMDCAPLVLYDTLSGYHAAHKTELREAALAKLTPEEKEVLGIHEHD